MDSELLKHFDTTIHLSDLIIFGGGIIAFLKVFLSVRDGLRDIARTVGSDDPPSGLVGRMQGAEHRLSEHHEWLIRVGIDQQRAQRQVDTIDPRRTPRSTEQH